ncbi:MAG: hypothetical protein WCH65_07680 [bacterium]
MSVQITLTHHNVSTDDNCLTNALFFANLPAAKDSAILTCAGNHSGIIAADTPTAKINASLTLK